MNWNIAFYPRKYGQWKSTIQTLEDILRAFVIYLQGKWDDHIPLIESSCNNSYHSSIQMAPYEVFMGEDVSFLLGGLKLVKQGW